MMARVHLGRVTLAQRRGDGQEAMMAWNSRQCRIAHPWMALLFVALLASPPASADPLANALANANACSKGIVKRGALQNDEDPRVMAGRAFDACIDQWAQAAHMLSARNATDPAVKATKENQRRFNGSLPANPYLGLRVAADKLRAGFVRRGSRKVSAMRASAAETAKSPPVKKE